MYKTLNEDEDEDYWDYYKTTDSCSGKRHPTGCRATQITRIERNKTIKTNKTLEQKDLKLYNFEPNFLLILRPQADQYVQGNLNKKKQIIISNY